MRRQAPSLPLVCATSSSGGGRLAHVVGRPCGWTMLHPPNRSRSAFRGLWIVAGLAACGLGFLGILLPGMPATVFFIAAAACFTRSSDRLLRWVLELPTVGPLVQDYRSGLGMPRSAKVWATVTMFVCVLWSVLRLPQLWQGALVALFASLGAAYIWLRIPSHRRLPARPARTGAPSPSVAPTQLPAPSPDLGSPAESRPPKRP